MAKKKTAKSKTTRATNQAAKTKTAAKTVKTSTKSPVKSASKSATKMSAKNVAKAPAPKASKNASKVVAKSELKTPAAKSSASYGKSAGKISVRFNPLDDRILVERVVGEERTASGLYIPDSAQEKPTTGRVVAVGRGHCDAKGRTRPCDVKVGDTVLFTAWSGSEIELDGLKYVIMRETDLLGVTNA